MSLTFGSLFAGIGGMDLGLERAGMTCRWQVEIDEYCRAVLAKHWPAVKRYGDVRDVGAHNLEPVDLICGGFPCQDVSVAGRRAGLDGERSGLWFEFARIIRELRPHYALVENVPGLLADGMGRVLGELAEIGYDAEWDCIPAAAVGAPHRRDRVFLVAYASRELSHWPRNGRTRRRAESTNGGAPVANPHGKRLEGLGPHSDPKGWQGSIMGPTGLRDRAGDGPRQWCPEPDVGRVAHGISGRVDRLRGLGNAVVPQVAEAVGRMIVEAT